eukprot:scaffold75849_cov66-Phaeocystis_antarctica.AAC.3
MCSKTRRAGTNTEYRGGLNQNDPQNKTPNTERGEKKGTSQQLGSCDTDLLTGGQVPGSEALASQQ